MTELTQRRPAPGFSPELAVSDPVAEHWVRQFTVRLRREVTWLRHLRGPLNGGPPQRVPDRSDPAQEALDLVRYQDDKETFFGTDATASYLTGLLGEPAPDAPGPRGGFGWVVGELGLNDAAAFTLGAAVAAALDGAVGDVVAACHSDAQRRRPDLGLVHRLWHPPDAVLALADPGHPLYRYGLLSWGAYGDGRGWSWTRPLDLDPAIARQLAYPDSATTPSLEPVSAATRAVAGADPGRRLVAARLEGPPDRLRVVPVIGRSEPGRLEAAATVARLAELPLERVVGAGPASTDPGRRNALAALAWLRGAALYLSVEGAGDGAHEGGHGQGRTPGLPAATIPATIFVGSRERDSGAFPSGAERLPSVDVSDPGYAERLALWREALGVNGGGDEGGGPWDGLGDAIAEVARRFRFGRDEIARVAASVRGVPTDAAALLAACRQELDLDLGDVAEKVEPRFRDERLILPGPQHRQFDELIRGMSALTEVHHIWGTADAWGESGISALFAGPPGTGKTMAAEVLARELDLPMYRVDLSQVVDKYIGETEKNLKRLFDAGDVGDLLLFFDEADALFGKRTDVKDSHDRYANLEISYLLQRMERFKGLAILATNRKSDLDEAFLRRLRFIIDFPAPGPAERRRLWRQMVPAGVDVDDLDIGFLAERFTLVGGHIRSVVLNACLQSASGAEGERRLSPETVLMAIKREYDKLGRPLSLQSFGPYAELIRQMDDDHA